MANAKKCDRCGEYYELERSEDCSFMDKHIGYVSLHSFSHKTIIDIDVCPKCALSFKEWLNDWDEAKEVNPVEPEEIDHVNCPYRKDVVCAPNGDGNRNCTMCDVYKQIFGEEAVKTIDPSFVVCPYLKNDTNGLACANTKSCKGPCELVLAVNEESKKEDEE